MRCQNSEYLVVKYLSKVPEAQAIIKEINDLVKRGIVITNVVSQNSDMKKKITDLTLELNKIKKETDLQESIKAKKILQDKIILLTTENEFKLKKLEDKEKIITELYCLNNKLSERLNKLNNKINTVIHANRGISTEENRRKSNKNLSKFLGTEIADKNINDKFEDISNIAEDNEDDINVITTDNKDPELKRS